MGPTAETLLDSLPYYDRDLELHPNLRALVDTEIDRELKRNSPPANELHPRVPKAIQLFEVYVTLLDNRS